jgi:hypothetical protein
LPAYVFSGNPGVFQVDRHLMRALSREQAIQWPVARYQEQIQPGDALYLYRTAGEGVSPGVIGIGRVVRAPESEFRSQPDLWHHPSRQPEWFSLIEVGELRLTPEAGMVTLDMLRKQPTLHSVVSRGGEIRLSFDQADALRVLWRRAAVQNPI